MQHIKCYGGHLEYSEAYEFAAKLLGHFAFDLFSPACYLALHFTNPGHNLEAILRRARECLDESDEIVFEDPLGYLVRAVQFPMDSLFPFALKQLVSPSSDGPRTTEAGLVGTTWPMTSQSKSTGGLPPGAV
jgi:hypothetical protein